MAFSFYRTVTIDPTKVDADLTDFPVLVSGTYSYLATVANGGNVQNASGFDIGFYADSALTSKLDWEIESYAATTGAVIYWVRVPSISSSVDTVIYLAYGDAGISTDQSDPTGVWDSNFVAVYHFGTPSVLSVTDSTSNAINGTNANVTASAGQIGGAGSFNGSSAAVDLGSVSAFTFGSGSYTIEAWIKSSNAGYQMIVGKDSSGAGERQFIAAINATDAGKFQFGNAVDLGVGGARQNYTDSAWNYVVGTRTTGSGLAEAYVDASKGTDGGDGNNYTVNSKVYIGRREFPGFAQWFNGQIDEVRISNVVRSADWIATTYNSQSSPSTFYAIGSAVAVSVERSTCFFIG